MRMVNLSRAVLRHNKNDIIVHVHSCTSITDAAIKMPDHTAFIVHLKSY